MRPARSADWLGLWQITDPGAASAQYRSAGLESDVPYFLYGGTALGSGRGERLRRLADVGACGGVVLVQPPFGVSTADAYRWADSAARAAAAAVPAPRRMAQPPRAVEQRPRSGGCRPPSRD